MKNKRIPKVTIIKATNPNYKQVAEVIVKLSQSNIDTKKDAS
jgi:predicted transcriptional regulator